MPSSGNSANEGDLVMLFFLTLLLAVLIAGCFRTPSIDMLQQQQQQQQQQRQGQGSNTRKAAATAVPSRPMSIRAKALQKELGLSYGSPVTITTHGVLLLGEENADSRGSSNSTCASTYSANTSSFVPQALDALRLLLEFADVFLIVHAPEGPVGDAERARVMALLRREGMVRGMDAQQQQQQQQQQQEAVMAHVRIQEVNKGWMCNHLAGIDRS